MGDENEGLSRDAIPPRGSRAGGPNVNADELRNFMPIFRSALNRVDNIDTAHDPPLSALSTSNPLRTSSTLSSTGRRRSGYDSYSGFRPEGLLLLAIGLSGSPYMPSAYDDVDYTEESFYESRPDSQRFGFSRSMSQRTAIGQSSSRVYFQAVRSSRSSRQSQAARMLANPLFQMLMLDHDEYCPFHGTGQHHHHHHQDHHHDHHATHTTNDPNDDHYTGPIITEIDDEGNDVDAGRTLALPPLEGPDGYGESIRSEKNKKDKNKNVNKNQVCKRPDKKCPVDDAGDATVSDVGNRKDGIEQDEIAQSTSKLASLQENKSGNTHAEEKCDVDELCNQQGQYGERYVQREANARSDMSLDRTTSKISHEFVHEEDHLSPTLDVPKPITDETFAHENSHMAYEALSPKPKGNADTSNGIMHNVQNIDPFKSEGDEGKTKPRHDETETCGDTNASKSDPAARKPEHETPIHRDDCYVESQQVYDDSDVPPSGTQVRSQFDQKNEINDDHSKEVTGTAFDSFHQMVKKCLPDIKEREEIECVIDVLNALSNPATTIRKQDSMPKRSFVNKNKTPQVRKTNQSRERQASSCNKSTFPKMPEHASASEDTHGSSKGSHDSSTNNTNKLRTGTNSGPSENVNPSPGSYTDPVGFKMPDDEFPESFPRRDGQSNRNSREPSGGSPTGQTVSQAHVDMHRPTDNRNGTGRHHSGGNCTERCNTYDRYAKKCLDSKRIHICCEKCDTITRSLCGKCEGCKKQIESFYKPQHQNGNHPMFSTDYHEGHHPNEHRHIEDGESSYNQKHNPLHHNNNNNTLKNNREMYQSNDQAHVPHPQTSYEQQALYQQQNRTRNNPHEDASKYNQGQGRDNSSSSSMQNERHQGQYIPQKESITSNHISTEFSRTNSWPGGFPNHPIDSNTGDVLGVLEEQHTRDDPFDHPDWQHLKDVESWNNSESSAPKKPPRNKNLHVKATSSGPTTGSVGRVPVRATSTPNFTSSSARLHGNLTGASGTASYSSDYNDNYKRHGGSSADRISNLSDAMLERGMVVKDVYPDGNCLFAAVVDQLRVRGEFFYTARSLRKAAVDYLRENPTQADGTPLLDFVPDHDTTTWEGYIARLDRDGEWADHIIISAITNVLKRRLVIHSIRRSDKQINQTIMEPALIVRSRGRKRPMSDSDGHEHAQADSPSISGDDSDSEGEADFEFYEDLQLGHIPEAHYVSLRYVDWEERLYMSLKTRKDDPSSHMTNYGSMSTRELGEAIHTPSDGATVPEIPWLHYEFLVRYLQTSNHCIRYPLADIDKTTVTVTYPFDGLCCRAIKTKQHPSRAVTTHRRDSTYGENNQAPNHGRAKRKDGVSDFFTLTSFLSPSDTYVHQERNKEMKPVDLFCDSNGCPPGYTKLRPIAKCWLGKLTQVDGKYYLKHLTIKYGNNESHQTKVAFRCELPDSALEWFERDRQYGWPSPAFIERLKSSFSCVVSAQSHPCSGQPTIEWKFSSELMERHLVKDEVTESQKKVFDIFQCLLAHVFPSAPIAYDHLKQVFFYTCERVNPQAWETCPSNCLQSMVELLRDSFQQDRLPNYFFSDVNTIDYLTMAEKGSCIERLEILVAYPFTMSYFMLDSYEEMSFHSDIITIDGLIEDVQTYAVDKDPMRTVTGCFVPLSIRGLSPLVSSRYFSKALGSSRTAMEHLNTMLDQPSVLSLKYFLYQVLYSVPNESIRWMFAMFLDQTINSSFLDMINAGHETMSLYQIFGLELKASFVNCTTEDIRVPTSFMEPGLLITFTKDMIGFLEEEMVVKDVVVADSLTYWFKHYSKDVGRYMATCSKAQQKVLSTQLRFLLVKRDYCTLKQENSTLRSLLGSFGRV